MHNTLVYSTVLDIITLRAHMRSRGKAIGFRISLSVCLSIVCGQHKNPQISRSRHLSDS
jgi:hypothetical protein